MIENGRKSDFRLVKKITSSFDVPPYRDFVILVIFHVGISRKIRTELGFELHSTRRSAPRRVERSNGMRHLLGNCVRLVAGPARSSRSRKELSLSRSMNCLRRSVGCSQVSKKTRFDRLVPFIPVRTRILFCQCSAAGCR